jgi:tRNA(fMet)-specific endonuclease VapC
MIEFRDIFIAATCIVNGFPVKTLNKKHYGRIKGLSIE